jgi:hypothetical protein
MGIGLVCRSGPMQSKKEIYQANANQCEVRAQEMPPGLRREFLALARIGESLHPMPPMQQTVGCKTQQIVTSCPTNAP